MILKYLYSKIENRWKYAMINERQMMERSLVSLIPNLHISKIGEAMKSYYQRFMHKYRSLKLLIGGTKEFDAEGKELWNQFSKVNEPS